jgi:hypothetical protein
MMLRTLVSLTALVVIRSGGARLSGDTLMRSALHDYRVVTVVDALVQPWSIAFLPTPILRMEPVERTPVR